MLSAANARIDPLLRDAERALRIITGRAEEVRSVLGEVRVAVRPVKQEKDEYVLPAGVARSDRGRSSNNATSQSYEVVELSD